MSFPKLAYLDIRKYVLRRMRGRYFVAKRSGSHYLIDIDNWIDRAIEAFGEYETPQIDCFFNLVGQLKASHFIDIGAHGGLYMMEAIKRDPSIQVTGFEPDQRNLAQLYANLFINHIEDSVRVHQVALSDAKGEVNFSRFADTNRGKSAVDPNGEHTVPCDLLDHICEFSGQRIGIKIDVEGYELNVLRGAKKLLMNNECVIQVECLGESDTLEALFHEYGYHRAAIVNCDRYYTNSASLKL